MEIRDVDNLVLNMMSGVLPEHLSKDEVEMLVEEYGDNWFYELGYDNSYEKPKY